ncbi:MAG: tRNA uridine-5-carboxymethylaminomethyl(34) synthesis enzyme MnmG [Bacteroidales bacterium]
MPVFHTYDIIVIGGGHAGCEAASAAATLGSRVLLVTMDIARFAQMSCNPSMGGVAKGQIVREIDAMGGYSGIIADKSTLQFRMLNRSKGPAMHSPRTQNDRMMFSQYWKEALQQNSNIDFWAETVSRILVKDDRIYGIQTQLGISFYAKAVIITAGTFLNGKIHIGEKSFSGGRLGEKASKGLSETLLDFGLKTDRMKTGTPVRVDGRTIDYSRLTIQHGDETPGKFSFSDTTPVQNQLPCYLAYTSPRVHDILATGFERSPLFEGRIKGIGPRYCPSIEDKIHRFSDKSSHQLFVEPEGRNTVEVYLNGFSSSLPLEIQYKGLLNIEGFEKARILQPGYAIEYDFFPPQQLSYTLETKRIQGLYLAGQVNGTTGYEEAAALGMIAGINAHLKIHNKEPFILSRSQAYIGVLVDDLINKGTDEPYRMFTSRAEYRILLRQDNADLRLTEISYKLGLASKERYEKMRLKQKRIQSAIEYFSTNSISPQQINPYLKARGESPIKQKIRIESLLKRPNVDINSLTETLEHFKEFWGTSHANDKEALEEAGILIKYQDYIHREQELAGKMANMDTLKIPAGINYMQIHALSYESREKLNSRKPENIGQASRISGVSPADITVLLVYLKKFK